MFFVFSNVKKNNFRNYCNRAPKELHGWAEVQLAAPMQ